MPPNKPAKPRAKKQAQQQPRKPGTTNKKKPEKKGPKAENNEHQKEEEDSLKIGIDFSAWSNTISPDLQQLLLNIFKYALLPSSSSSSSSYSLSFSVEPEEDNEKDLHTQIQTLKTHLFNRDFEAAFADASPSLLRAYALRWSASRCLAYVGLFRGVVECILSSQSLPSEGNGDGDGELGVLCIGGGAGAEIVALAGVWRAIEDEILRKEKKEEEENLAKDGLAEIKDTEEEVAIGALSLTGNDEQQQVLETEGLQESEKKQNSNNKQRIKKLSITAVDIAEWSDVIHRLDKSIHSADIPGSKTCTAPLIHGNTNSAIEISFQHLDILSLPEEGLKSLLSQSLDPSEKSDNNNKDRKTRLISLMFTLNELFSTSISKTTKLLLRLTDLSEPGTILLVVDSPGSYSTLSFSNAESSSSSAAAASSDKQKQKQRQYPMKFLLDHTLLTVAEGMWEKLVSQDSRWFRRDANSKLHYNVDLEGGQGFIKLEDMRFQIHVYRRLASSSSSSSNTQKADGTDKVKRS